MRPDSCRVVQLLGDNRVELLFYGGIESVHSALF
jgi:hypothetical protein